MHPLLMILLKSGIASAVLYIYYCIALIGTKYYKYNRFYLLSAVAFSLVVPFLHFSLFRVGTSHSRPVIGLLQVIAGDRVEEELTNIKHVPSVSYQDILLTGYAIISLVILILTA